MKKIVIALLWALVLVAPMVFAGDVLGANNHDVRILDSFVSEHSKTCSEQLDVQVLLKNNGYNDERVWINVYNPQLGIDEYSELVSIPTKRLFFYDFKIPVDKTTRGTYDLETTVRFANHYKQYVSSVGLNGCPKQDITSELSFTGPSEPVSQPVKERLGFSTVLALLLVIFVLALIAIFILVNIFS